MLIYKATNTKNGKCYIGQTKQSLDKRIQEHKRLAYSGNGFYFHSAIREYGIDSFVFEILDTASSQEELDRLEDYYINLNNSISDGYNLIGGGYRNNPMNFDNVKEYHDSVMKSEEVRKKISDTMKLKYKKSGGFSEEHKKNLSKNKLDFYSTEHGKEVAKHHSMTFHPSKEHLEALSRSKFKKVMCVDVDGNVLHEFESVKSAALWWSTNGGPRVSNLRNLSNTIKRSSKNNSFVNGVKWVYCV